MVRRMSARFFAWRQKPKKLATIPFGWYHSVWVGDSVTAKPRLEALTTLGALSARTSRIQLGTAVFLAALRHPLVIAHAVASLDVLSTGRIILGVGAGRGGRSILS